jgi:hypothetical protein
MNSNLTTTTTPLFVKSVVAMLWIIPTLCMEALPMSKIYPKYDRATGEYLFQNKWYPDYESVQKAIEDYEEALLQEYEMRIEEEKLRHYKEK